MYYFYDISINEQSILESELLLNDEGKDQFNKTSSQMGS